MAINQDATKKYVTAGVAVAHGAPASDDGFVGQAHLQTTKDISNTARDRLAIIEATERYLLKLNGEIEVPIAASGGAGAPVNVLTGATVGQLVYITDATNVLTLTTAAGKSVLGKVSCLPGERACPTGFLRVNLNQKA